MCVCVCVCVCVCLKEILEPLRDLTITQINYEVKVEAMRAAAAGINTCVVSFQRLLTLYCTQKYARTGFHGHKKCFGKTIYYITNDRRFLSSDLPRILI